MGFDITKIVSAPQTAAQESENAVVQVDIDSLIPYHDHKFRLYSGERFDDMVQSISKNGVLVPLIILKIDEAQAKLAFDDESADFYDKNIGKYEILSGHNRMGAAKAAGLKTVPAVVKSQLTDNEIESYVYETNLIQRSFSDMSISEQAAVVSHRHSAMFNKEKAAAIREELHNLETGCETEEKQEKVIAYGSGDKSKLAAVGAEYGLSRASIARLVRINSLTEELKMSVDLTLISVRAGVELSYIPEAAQRAVFGYFKKSFSENGIDYEAAKIDMKTASGMRELFEGFDEDEKTAAVMLESYIKGAKDKPKKPKVRKINADVYSKYFDEDETDEYINSVIDEALAEYFKGKGKKI